jgi:hypothetical protein
MGHGPATFKETDLTRALRAAQKAGADVVRVEVGRDGRIVLVLKNGDKVLTERNEWDVDYGPDQTEIHKRVH